MPLASKRPKCNSILHLFGAWLFDAAFVGVKINTVHKNAGKRIFGENKKKKQCIGNYVHLKCRLHSKLMPLQYTIIATKS